MHETEDTFELKEELENLRGKLNIEAAKNIKDINKDEYKGLLDISRKLDDVIVKYIKSFANESEITY